MTRAWLRRGGVLALSMLLLTSAGCVANFAPASDARPDVDQAATAAGVTVCSSRPLRDLSPGGTAGTSFIVAADCSDPSSQTLVISETFENEAARDRAIRAYTEAGPGHAPDREQVFYTLGNTLFTVVGPHDDAVFALVDQHLRQLGAQ